MTRDEFEQTCKDVCPSCANGDSLRQREDTGEFVHDIHNKNAFSHVFCLASNYRNKHRDQVSG